MQIVKMSDSMTMMFEAEDLEQASPATVSRVGMIYCEIRNLDWQPLRDIWLESLPITFEEHRLLVAELFEWLFPAALYFVTRKCAIPTPVTGQVWKIQLDNSPKPGSLCSVGDYYHSFASCLNI